MWFGSANHPYALDFLPVGGGEANAAGRGKGKGQDLQSQSDLEQRSAASQRELFYRMVGSLQYQAKQRGDTIAAGASALLAGGQSQLAGQGQGQGQGHRSDVRQSPKKSKRVSIAPVEATVCAESVSDAVAAKEAAQRRMRKVNAAMAPADMKFQAEGGGFLSREAVAAGREEILLFCGTWNVGGNSPPSIKELGAWLPRPGSVDVYAIALQEATHDLGGVEGKMSGGVEGFWKALLLEHVGDGYAVVACRSLLHIRFIVLAKKAHAFKITNVMTDTVGTGIAGVYGNKGAVGCTLHFHETRLAFVACHLAAHEDATRDRLEDVAQIVRALRLGNSELDAISQAHHTIWLGDLNYRVNLSWEEGAAAIRERHWHRLLERDQLRLEQDAGRLLSGFTEAPVRWMPSYRFEVGAHDESCLDGGRVLSRKKNQTASYTDRVLWRSLPGCTMEALHYRASHGITTSDHSPVGAVMRFDATLPAFRGAASGGAGRLTTVLVWPSHAHVMSRGSSEALEALERAFGDGAQERRAESAVAIDPSPMRGGSKGMSMGRRAHAEGMLGLLAPRSASACSRHASMAVDSRTSVASAATEMSVGGGTGARRRPVAAGPLLLRFSGGFLSQAVEGAAVPPAAAVRREMDTDGDLDCSVTASWDDEVQLDAPVDAWDAEAMEAQHLFVTLWEDRGGPTRRRMVGQGAVSLKAAATLATEGADDSGDESVPFVTELCRHGLRVGTLRGRVAVRSRFTSRSKRAQSVINLSGVL